MNRVVKELQEIKLKILFENLDQFPDHGNLTLAKKIYAENPLLWSCLETVRNAVRFYRGAMGKKNRNQIQNKTYVKPLPTT
jgi:hypothetical protein